MAKKRKNKKRYDKYHWKARFIALLVIVAIVGAGFLFEEKINYALGLKTDEVNSTLHDQDGNVIETLDGNLKVHFVDVGQGDACIVELPDDRNMLIDAGENRAEVKQKLETYINDTILDDDNTPIDYFDYCIMTHSDSDHIGSMAYIFGLFPAKTVYRPNQAANYEKNGVAYVDPAYNGRENRHRFWGSDLQSKNTATYKNAIEAAYKSNDDFTPEVIVTNPYDDTQNEITSAKAGVEYSITFYSPLSSSYSDNNNYSPIIILQYGDKSITLTGDAETKNEQEFVQKAKEGEGKYSIFTDTFTVDVIKLGHHGSGTSSTEGFLEVMTTDSSVDKVLVVISCGKDNKYGHPHTEVLDRLKDMGFSDDRILRTDLSGDIVVGVAYEEGEYTLSYGENVITTADKSIAGVPVTYREIAFAIVVLAFVFLILTPLGIKLKAPSKK